jgi:hypothetical protein
MGHVAHIGEIRNENNILPWKPKQKRPLQRHRLRWEDNIKLDIK